MTFAELSTYRFRADLGAPTVGSEWTSETAATNAMSGNVETAIYMTIDQGVPGAQDVTTGSLPYRCAAPAAP